MNRERALASLSMVTAVWEMRNKDYLDNFVPFIATFVVAQQIEKITLDDLASVSLELQELFGIKIPVLPFKAILKKSTKQKILAFAGGEYRVNRTRAIEASIMSDLRDNERNNVQIVTELQEFAVSRYGIELLQSVAEDILYDFVNSNDLEILSREEMGQDAPLDAHLPRRYRQYKYLVNAFYLYASQENPKTFESISKMAMGSLLAATMRLPEIPDRGQTVKGVEFVLDTPLLLKLIGADGPAEHSVVRRLIEDLTTHGGTLSTYTHIQQETLEILDSARRWVEALDFDATKASRTTIFFRQEGFKESDVVRMIGKIGDLYSKYSIAVKDVPRHGDTIDHQIDEEELTRVIEVTIAEGQSQFDAELFKRRTQRDVDSISAVYRMRGGHRPRQLRDSRVILVTENTALVLANKRLVASVHQDLAGFPACVTDQYVGTVLWINAPEAATGMNRNRLLASSCAALRPDASLAKAIANEAARLRKQGEITGDDFAILTADHLTKDLLAEKTLGDKEALDSPKVLQILSEVKARLLEAAGGEIKQLNKTLASASQEKLAATIERDQTKMAVIGYVEKRAKRIASTCKIVFRVFVWTFLLAPVLPAIFIHPMIGGITLALAAVFNVVGYMGLKPDSVYGWVYHRARKRKLKSIGVSDDAA